MQVEMRNHQEIFFTDFGNQNHLLSTLVKRKPALGVSQAPKLRPVQSSLRPSLDANRHLSVHRQQVLGNNARLFREAKCRQTSNLSINSLHITRCQVPNFHQSDLYDLSPWLCYYENTHMFMCLCIDVYKVMVFFSGVRN